jgi:hypothetical protein
MNKAMTTSKSPSYRTPQKLYDTLNAEFNFNDDPCPLSDNGIDGLMRAWGNRTFMNPPYGKHISKWMMKAYSEAQLGKTIVCLVPSRTDTIWWHEWVTKANETRFIKGRLTFEGQVNPAPFPSAIVIYKGD